MKILVATGNPGKIKEYREFFSELDITFLSLEDININRECAENGETLEENSFQKASFYGDLSQEVTIADDTGLFVKALDGRPGVRSARYGSTDEERMEKLLGELKGIRYNNRNATFKLVITLYFPKEKKYKQFTGEIEGKIVKEKRKLAQRGFGYDPIFYVENKGKTFGEMFGEEKNKISHRGIAFRKLKNYLKNI